MNFYKHRLCLSFPPTNHAPYWYANSEYVWKSEDYTTPYYMFSIETQYYIHTSPILDFIDDDGVLYKFTGDFIDGFPIWKRQDAQLPWLLRYSLYLNAWLIHNESSTVPYKPVQSDAISYGWFQSQISPNSGILFTPKGDYAESFKDTTIHLSLYGRYVNSAGFSSKFTNPLDSSDTRQFGYQGVQCSAIADHTMYIKVPRDSDNVLQLKDIHSGQVLCFFKVSSSGYVAVLDGVQWDGNALPPHNFTSGTVQYKRQNEQGSTETITFTSKGIQEGLHIGAERQACYYGDVAIWV